eukprot:TRINITY_DN14679_c0_g1_i1.p1 TRINITY_DN14679_c0_g1~~TRINITY_DN14679_c0_g1_i1.p1  ORF type:complete len:275 (+),score=50.84 TRINITY_DN14679_c0_g1_i1:65-889(+)
MSKSKEEGLNGIRNILDEIGLDEQKIERCLTFINKVLNEPSIKINKDLIQTEPTTEDPIKRPLKKLIKKMWTKTLPVLPIKTNSPPIESNKNQNKSTGPSPRLSSSDPNNNPFEIPQNNLHQSKSQENLPIIKQPIKKVPPNISKLSSNLTKSAMSMGLNNSSTELEIKPKQEDNRKNAVERLIKGESQYVEMLGALVFYAEQMKKKVEEKKLISNKLFSYDTFRIIFTNSQKLYLLHLVLLEEMKYFFSINPVTVPVGLIFSNKVKVFKMYAQ